MSAGRLLPGTPTPMHTWKGAGGLVIAGDAWGDPKGPLVLLQHGGGQTRHAWKDAGERLGAAGYRAVAFDARGHGDSEWAKDGDYTQDAMVEDLLCVVEALGDPRPVLVGASMGGGTSLTAVGEDRIDATALVLVDIAHRVEPEGVTKIRAFMGQKPDGFDSLEEVADAIVELSAAPQAQDQPGRIGQEPAPRRRTENTGGTGIRNSMPAFATSICGSSAWKHARAIFRCRPCWCAAAFQTSSARKAPASFCSCVPARNSSM